MNHNTHINLIFVVHVKCTPSYGGGKLGSCEPKKTQEPQKGSPCVFCGSHEPQKHMVDLFLVHVNHKYTWWTHLWFM
jgi:hypothetical protein